MDDNRMTRWLRGAEAEAPAKAGESPRPGSAADALSRIRPEMGSATPRTSDTADTATKDITMDQVQTTPPTESPSVAVIVAGTRVKMEYESDKDINIYGEVEGRLVVNRLFVGAGAVVSGNVQAAEIRNHGRITGEITAGSLILYKGCEVSGEVKCRTLGVQPGSTLKARIDADVTQQIEAGDRQNAPLGSTGFEADFSGATALRVVSTR